MANPDTDGSVPGPEDERENDEATRRKEDGLRPDGSVTGPEDDLEDEEAARRQAAGLRPIMRLGSDQRLARIQPETDSRTVISYCSTFVRDFVARDYNYCTSKFTLARGGKLKALDIAFREAEEAFAKALGWLEFRPSLDIHLLTDKQTVELKHPLAGRLVRLLNQHDRIFSLSLCAMTAGGISPQDRDNATEHASRRISLIHAVCMPDNDQFAADGTRLSAISR